MSALKSLTCVSLLLSLLLPLSAAHAATPAAYVFVTVDRYEIDLAESQILVTGILEGEAVARPVAIPFYWYGWEHTAPLERCEKLALLSMASPGRYKFELNHEAALKCALARVQP
jgi:hypothetical protein